MKSLVKLFLPVVILAAGAWAFMALKSTREEPAAIGATEHQWVVTAETVQRDVHRPLARLYGRVESSNRSTLSAALAAEVTEVRVREGDAVTAGALLVRLDHGNLLLTLDQREADIGELKARIDGEMTRYRADREALEEERALLELARRNLERVRRLAINRAGSEAGVDDAREVIRNRSLAVIQRQYGIDDHAARLARLEASMAHARAARAAVLDDIERTYVRAPFDSRVTEVNVSPGERLRAGDVLLELFDTGEQEIRAQIPERHLATVRDGLDHGRVVRARTVVEGVSHPLVLDRLAGQVRAGQGGLDGFFRFVDVPAGGIEVGRVVTLAVSLPAVEDVVSLPVSALYGSDTVYRIVDGRLDPVAVRHVGDHDGADGERRVLLQSNQLADGDRVVSVQIPAAVDGLKVEVSER